MTIYFTGRGDKGKSDMGARKIAKDDPLFEVLGALDELNSWLGYCGASRTSLKFPPDSRAGKSLKLQVRTIQEDLFIAQAEIAMKALGQKSQPDRQAGKIQITNAKTKRLEEEILKIDKIVPPIKKFIIPGGSELSAGLDYARALARRAERMAVKANFLKPNTCSPELLQYLNRLSSYLFALARLVNFRAKIKERNPGYR